MLTVPDIITISLKESFRINIEVTDKDSVNDLRISASIKDQNSVEQLQQTTLTVQTETRGGKSG